MDRQVKKILVTGASGLVGSQVVQRLLSDGLKVRALVRSTSPFQTSMMARGVELIVGDLESPDSLDLALAGVDFVVHCAAHVGDWGEGHTYQRINVDALQILLQKAIRIGTIKRFILISSLGVYPAKDHFGSDETMPINLQGIDPYTRSKALAEILMLDAVKAGLNAVALRPGFIYGPGDRQVLPRLVESLVNHRFVFVGSGKQLLNHTGVENLAYAVSLSLNASVASGSLFNITDEPLVSRKRFVEIICDELKMPVPKRSIPTWMGRPLALVFDGWSRAVKSKEPPMFSMARYKFLALNLEYSIERARRELGYQPLVSVEEGLRKAVRALGKSPFEP